MIKKLRYFWQYLRDLSDHDAQEEMDLITSGLYGYWKSSLRAERCKKYGWD